MIRAVLMSLGTAGLLRAPTASAPLIARRWTVALPAACFVPLAASTPYRSGAAAGRAFATCCSGGGGGGLGAPPPPPPLPPSSPPRIVVVGGGFGGLYTALRLDSLTGWPGGVRPVVTLVR